MKNDYIYSILLSGNGFDLQIEQLVEEFAECIVAIKHWQRSRIEFSDVITELTHADQMIKQIRYISNILYSRNLWKREQRKTHQRLLKLIENVI